MSDFKPAGYELGGMPVYTSPFVEEGTAYIIPGHGMVAAPGAFAKLTDMPTPEPTDSIVQKIIDRLRREAVVVLPLIYSIIALVPEHTRLVDWRVWGPIAVGFLLRTFFTSPVHEVEAKETDAFKAGVQLGKNLAVKPPAQ